MLEFKFFLRFKEILFMIMVRVILLKYGICLVCICCIIDEIYSGCVNIWDLK